MNNSIITLIFSLNLAIVLEHIRWSTTGHIKYTLKGYFSLSSEVDLCQWFIIVLHSMNMMLTHGGHEVRLTLENAL